MRSNLFAVLLCLILPVVASGARLRQQVQATTLNLSDFGASGDGVADDGPALQAALDALAAAGGGTLFVPAGHYALATPVMEDFSGVANPVVISGVESPTPVDTKGGGQELTQGLNLTSEFIIRVGDQSRGLTFLFPDNSLLIHDVAFLGVNNVATDAAVSLALYSVKSATIRHCEFYGLSTMGGGSVLHADTTDLRIEDTAFLGCTGNSGLYTPVVRNTNWTGFTISHTVMADYGQRPNFYGKTGFAAAIAWVMLGPAAVTTNLSPRREATFSDIFLDEGALFGIASLPERYWPSEPADLVSVSDLRMNVSSVGGASGLYLSKVRRALVERAQFGLSHHPSSAVTLAYVGNAVVDQAECGASADRITLGATNDKLTVLNSTYTYLDSQAGTTEAYTTAPEDDPVQIVRQHYADALGSEPDAAGLDYWSDRLFNCGADADCLTSREQDLSTYLGTSPAPRFSVAGRVIDETGSPLPGVAVALGGSQSVGTTSAADGTFVFADLPTSGAYTLTPQLTHYSFDKPSLTVVTPPGDQPVSFIGTLNRHSITGHIADASGAAIPGATLTLSGAQSGSATTDSQGNYSFANLPAGKDYTVSPSLTNYTFSPPSLSFTDLGSDQAANFTAALNNYSISGHVTRGGAGLSGVTVRLSGGQTKTFVTGTDGAYSFTVPAGKGYTVTPSKQNYAFAPASQQFDALGGSRTADFIASLVSYTISGRVTDGASPSPGPLNGITVTLADSTAATTTTAATDAQGNFSFTAIAEHDYTLTPAGNALYNFTPQSLANLSGNQQLTFAGALRSYTVSGRVAGGNGQPVTVTLGGGQSATTTTDAQGNYSFANVPAGKGYTVTPSRANYTFAPQSASISNLISNGSADFTATLNSYTISGQVSASGSPLAGVSVALTGSQSNTAQTSPDGRYSFTVPAEGNYTVTASKANYSFAPATRSFASLGGNQSADFAASLVNYVIGGRVMGAGVGLSGVTVTLSGISSATTATDAQGNFSFTATAEHDYTVTPSSNALYSFTAQSVTNLGGDRQLTFAGALRSYALSGHVTASGGNGVGSVTVTLGGGQSAATTTDSQGNYSFANLLAGKGYTVTPSRADYTFAAPFASISNLISDQTADFTATLKNYTISGQVLAGSTPLAGVSVALTGSQSGTAQTGADGRYSFSVPAEGSYTVTASRRNYTFAPASKTFPSLSGNQSFDFPATINHYSITGRATDASGAAIPGATLTLSGAQSGSATTDSQGNYSFANLAAEADYAVTASKANYTFAPASRPFANLSADQSADFTGALLKYSITGALSDASGAAIPGATVTLGGSSGATTTTDAQGNYSFASISAGGTYTITPSKPFYTFSPASRTLTNLAGDQAASNFTGTLGRYTVSGRVTVGGADDALSGVAITMSGGASASATTDARGNYSFANVPGGASVTLAPALANYTFAPAQQSINVDGDRPGIDFVATPLPAVLRFSQARYQVNEDAQRVVVTVTRAGNTSTAVGVDVRTLDDPAPVPCGDTQTLPGVAFARCDYATTAETLSFAAGETTKAVSVPVIDDSWVEPSETFQLALSNPTGGAQLGQQATATVAIADNDAPGEQNPIFSTDFFVRQQYLDFLSREPEAGQPWSSVLNNCAPDDASCDRVSVSANFFRSQEFQLKGLFVFKFYKVAFGRLPHYSEIVADMRAVTGSTTAELIAKKAAFTDAFAQRQEFKAAYDGLDNLSFVNALLDRYGLQSITAPNPATPDDQSSKRSLSRADLVSGLNTSALTRAQVLRAVADSDEVGSAEFNSAFVAMQYYGYLRRDPDPQGYANWLATINANPSDFRSMVNGFVNSTEYRLRFGQP